ncbi:nuclear transport factor 2 family protein [Kribbella kalugense]|uniref:SnoaL-like protein n=1 Tax=Kribbella kalugense TaxID=2512221 RepID=A0A4R8A412_9ACTN|nr:nuclear transport factor 2 family protein [Kribbella kalugense]TDW24198.1 SnoaL-like protein [Kribbella kalugense]
MATESDQTGGRPVDRLAIQDLVFTYNHALDTGDEELFVSLFVPAATNGPKVGVDAIRDAFRKTAAKYAELHHLSSNLVVDFDGDQATGRSKALIFRSLPGEIADGNAPMYVDYDDVYVHTGQGWKFLSRSFRAADIPPAVVAPPQNRGGK